jgi:hypothetical protein
LQCCPSTLTRRPQLHVCRWEDLAVGEPHHAWTHPRGDAGSWGFDLVATRLVSLSHSVKTTNTNHKGLSVMCSDDVEREFSIIMPMFHTPRPLRRCAVGDWAAGLVNEAQTKRLLQRDASQRSGGMHTVSLRPRQKTESKSHSGRPSAKDFPCLRCSYGALPD